jgi:hypothetical protein
LSFVFRCEGKGPWEETITVKKMVKSTRRKNSRAGPFVRSTHSRDARYSKLEYELVMLRKLAELKPLDAQQSMRIDELETLLPDGLKGKSESELEVICLRWFEALRATASKANAD